MLETDDSDTGGEEFWSEENCDMLQKRNGAYGVGEGCLEALVS